MQRVVRFPEQILAVVLQSLVEDSKDEDHQHGPDEAAATRGRPLLEQNRFVVSAVELKRNRSRENWNQPQASFSWNSQPFPSCGASRGSPSKRGRHQRQLRDHRDRDVRGRDRDGPASPSSPPCDDERVASDRETFSFNTANN